ncbi:acyltransferase [Halomonas sp. PR-M31]|uniref:acyltransferase family protein n=1 Tax=Halomonas sp. PR-M31 TaxID=1471202 RepID=UPI0012E0E2F2|nr:acyltransferase [Halomonas sp. PR-M31]
MAWRLSPLRLITWGLPSAALIIAFISLETAFKANTICKTLGNWSYSTYLLHVIVLWTAQYVLGETFGLAPYAILGLCLPIILLLSWGSYEFIEKRFARYLKHALSAVVRHRKHRFLGSANISP